MVRFALQRRMTQTQVFLEAVIILLSALVFFPLSKTTADFKQNCLLNANIYVTKFNNKSVSLNLENTVFGDIYECNCATFINVVIALHGIVWIWFFFHLETLTGKNGSVLSLLLPSLVTHLVFFFCGLVASVKIVNGFNVWCDNIKKNNNKILNSKLSCKDYQSLSWVGGYTNFYTFTQMAMISSFLLDVVLCISIGVTCTHLYWDFLSSGFVPDNSSSKLPLETSGYSDNGVGIINKGAQPYNELDDFYTDNESLASYDSQDLDASLRMSPTGDRPPVSDGSSHLVVNAAVHNNSDKNSQGPDYNTSETSSLRSRGSTSNVQ